jgi:hypothetical protein
VMHVAAGGIRVCSNLAHLWLSIISPHCALPPHPYPPTPQLVGKLSAGERLEIPPHAALPGPDTHLFAGLDAYIGLLQRCWAQDPAERPRFQEVIQELRRLLEAHAKVVGAVAA